MYIVVLTTPEDYTEFASKMDTLLQGQDKSFATILTVAAPNNFGVRYSIRNRTCLMTFRTEDEVIDFAKYRDHVIF